MYIEKCARDYVNDVVDKMLPTGGFVNPVNYKTYNGENITYLCEHIGYYKPCINQHPMYLDEMKGEIHGYIFNRIDNCFDELKKVLEKNGNVVTIGEQNISVELAPDRIFVKINRKLTMEKNGQTMKYNEFNADIKSPLYNLAKIAIEIASQQAKFCYFEYVGYMILYPRYSIDVFAMSDSTKIYSIEDRESGKKLNIAIRSCAIPPGI